MQSTQSQEPAAPNKNGEQNPQGKKQDNANQHSSTTATSKKRKAAPSDTFKSPENKKVNHIPPSTTGKGKNSTDPVENNREKDRAIFNKNLNNLLGENSNNDFYDICNNKNENKDDADDDLTVENNTEPAVWQHSQKHKQYNTFDSDADYDDEADSTTSHELLPIETTAKSGIAKGMRNLSQDRRRREHEEKLKQQASTPASNNAVKSAIEEESDPKFDEITMPTDTTNSNRRARNQKKIRHTRDVAKEFLEELVEPLPKLLQDLVKNFAIDMQGYSIEISNKKQSLEKLLKPDLENLPRSIRLQCTLTAPPSLKDNEDYKRVAGEFTAAIETFQRTALNLYHESGEIHRDHLISKRFRFFLEKMKLITHCYTEHNTIYLGRDVDYNSEKLTIAVLHYYVDNIPQDVREYLDLPFSYMKQAVNEVFPFPEGMSSLTDSEINICKNVLNFVVGMAAKTTVAIQKLVQTEQNRVNSHNELASIIHRSNTTVSTKKMDEALKDEAPLPSKNLQDLIDSRIMASTKNILKTKRARQAPKNVKGDKDGNPAAQKNRQKSTVKSKSVLRQKPRFTKTSPAKSTKTIKWKHNNNGRNQGESNKGGKPDSKKRKKKNQQNSTSNSKNGKGVRPTNKNKKEKK